MCSPRRYEDILADILDKRHSACVCPQEYLTAPHKPKTPCNFGPNCKFDKCAYDAAVCTCATCTCGYDLPPAPPPAATSLPACVCPGPCLCESDESLLPKCDRSACVCPYCTCERQASSSNLLPTSLRTVLKREGRRMMTDEEMREERQAMKRLMDEVASPDAEAEAEERKPVRRKKSKSEKIDEDPGRKEEQRQIDDSPKQSLKSAKVAKVSIALPAETNVENRTSVKKQSGRLSKDASARTSKKPKSQKRIPSPKTTKSTMQYRSRLGTAEKKRPLRIRYYYAGGVESYGVKMGHAYCLEKPVSVPKNMGWLWNIEDPSKGIRQRKGWPPGFIGKNIKNMIQVMKMFASGDQNAREGEAREARRWRTQPDTRVERGGEGADEPPLLHVRKKGRTYDITFCPKGSDDDIGPVPIPFSITQKRRDGDSETSDDSSLELEFHSPKPGAPWLRASPVERPPSVDAEETRPPPPPPPEAGEQKPASVKGKRKKKRSAAASEENRNNWEDQPTQIENVPSSTVAGS